jgi:hypothetical protein
MSKPEFTAEDFEAWREQPITAWVLSGVQRFADLQADHWGKLSWDSGNADQATLDRLKTRADAYEGLAQLTFEQAQGLHDDAQEG